MTLQPTMSIGGFSLCPACTRRAMGYREPTIEDIKSAVAAACGLHVCDLESTRRTPRVLHARVVAIALAARLTSHSSTVIGRALRKESSTVRYVLRNVTPSLDRIEQRLAREAALHLWVEAALAEISVVPKRKGEP